MDVTEDLSYIIEQAFQYASVLPTSPNTEDVTSISRDSSVQPEVKSTEQNHPDYFHGSHGHVIALHNSELMECLSIVTRSNDTESRGKNIATTDIYADEVLSDSIFTQLQPGTAMTEVHSDGSSDVISDIRDTAEIDYIRLQLQTDESENPTPIVETDDGKPTRKRRRREKNTGPAPEPILPPCSICDEKSSGYHYGVNTCEACKGFYRRSLKKKKISYRCKCNPDEKEAWERGPFKNGCTACRFERCLAVGMSRNAIKIGRYTLDHKTKNIKEVKSVEAMDSFIRTLTQTLPETSPSTSGFDMPHLEEEDLNIIAPAIDVTALSTELSTNPPSPSGDDLHQLKRQKTSLPDPQDESISEATTSQPQQTHAIGLKEIDSVVKTLTEAHITMRFDRRINIPTEIMKQRQQEYSEKYRLKKELFGDMRILTKEEYTEFYNITGMDLDGRLEQVHAALTFFEDSVSRIVGFAKAIPGFRQLPLDDQANLVKATRVESVMLSNYKSMMRNFDTESRVFTTPWGTHMHLDEMPIKWIPKGVLVKRRKLAEQLLELNLTVQEDSVIRSIVIASSDRCPLDEPQKVDAIQEKLVVCLQHLLNNRPGGSGTLLYKIFSFITRLRELNFKEMDFVNRFFNDWPVLASSKFHLLKECVT